MDMLPQEVITSNRSTTFPFLPLNTTVRPICMARSYLNASIIILGSLIVSASINAIGSLFLYVSIIGMARSLWAYASIMVPARSGFSDSIKCCGSLLLTDSIKCCGSLRFYDSISVPARSMYSLLSSFSGSLAIRASIL